MTDCTRCEDKGKVRWCGDRNGTRLMGPCPKCCPGPALLVSMKHRDSIWPRSAITFSRPRGSEASKGDRNART